ncbi:MAG TPA: hypothetical protein VFT12_14145 [Thermoanaerobaculia bacterium]|nr:hypothetical protein [Thermoanaerobaculia bacterium]
MISCDLFRAQFAPSTEDAALLEHLRACDACLAVALAADPEVLFRSIGGGELVPPGGVDAFVGDVMREVRLRSTETVMGQPISRPRRLAIAATIAIGVIGGAAFYRYERISGPVQPLTIARAEMTAPASMSRPAVEAYDSGNATIVEVPAEGVDDVRVVMVFDESLPADL